MNNWLILSFTSMTLLVPAWLAIGFFDRNFGVNPTVFVVWYFLGVISTASILATSNGTSLVPSWPIVLGIILIGMTIGGVANILLFNAVSLADNPGTPVAIANVASVGVFIAAALLARWLPQYFQQGRFDLWTLIGIAMTVGGIAIIVMKK